VGTELPEGSKVVELVVGMVVAGAIETLGAWLALVVMLGIELTEGYELDGLTLGLVGEVLGHKLEN